MNDELSMINADNNTIPDSCLSYSEQALYVSEKMRENYNEALKYIGAFELAIYEATNNQLQYNSEKSINMLQNKLTGIYESDFATMKGFWTGVVADINEAVMNSRSYDLMLVEESDITKSSYGTTHSFFDPEKVKFYANADKVINLINNKMSKLADADQNAIDAVKAELEKRICSSISGVQGASNVKEMKETLKEKLIGKTIEADDKFVKKNLDKMKSIVTGKSSIKIAKNAYKSEKAAIKSAISAAKKAGASNKTVVKAWHSLLTDVLSVLHACYATQLDVHKRQYHEYKNILVKCKKAGICESTYISSEDIERIGKGLLDMSKKKKKEESQSSNNGDVPSDIKKPIMEVFELIKNDLGKKLNKDPKVLAHLKKCYQKPEVQNIVKDKPDYIETPEQIDWSSIWYTYVSYDKKTRTYDLSFTEFSQDEFFYYKMDKIYLPYLRNYLISLKKKYPQINGNCGCADDCFFIWVEFNF